MRQYCFTINQDPWSLPTTRRIYSLFVIRRVQSYVTKKSRSTVDGHFPNDFPLRGRFGLDGGSEN